MVERRREAWRCAVSRTGICLNRAGASARAASRRQPSFRTLAFRFALGAGAGTSPKDSPHRKRIVDDQAQPSSETDQSPRRANLSPYPQSRAILSGYRETLVNRTFSSVSSAQLSTPPHASQGSGASAVSPLQRRRSGDDDDALLPPTALPAAKPAVMAVQPQPAGLPPAIVGDAKSALVELCRYDASCSCRSH